MAKSKSLQSVTPKPKIKRRAKAKKDLIPAPKDEVLDEDAAFKVFFTKHVQDFIAILNPPLHDAIDWSVLPHFCEQELINFLRGRLRQLDKRKIADKLLQLKLKDGKDIFVFVHNEFQNALEDELAHRWFRSRVLISLRYNVEDITTLIIFTGDAPKKKHSFYDHTCFGTRTTFQTNAFVVVKQNVKQLIARNTPAAYAFLAAKYAVMSKNDMAKRVILKKKVFELVKKAGFDGDNMESILTFVFDYMQLPKYMEDDFQSTESFYQQPKSEKKMMTRGAILAANIVCFKETGMTYNEFIEVRNAEVETIKEAAKEEVKAAKEAIKEAAKEEVEAAKEATKETARIRNIQIIHAMLEDGFPIERIAHILKISVDYANELAKMTA